MSVDTTPAVALRVHHISKSFEIYQKPVHRLLQSLCRGRKRFFREFKALDDVDFEVRRGECVGIIGRNGAGKSTLLQIMTGTLQPTAGSVETYGRVAALLELGSGFNPEFTGRENIFMNGAILGLSEAEVRAQYDEIVDFADIGDFIDQPVKTYSSGMMVRLAFAVATHVDADILIVDEALSVGDAFFVQKCMRFMRKFMETKTVVFVSHDTAAVAGLCNKVILLENGAVQRIGSAKDVTEYYLARQFRARQGGGEIADVAATDAVAPPAASPVFDPDRCFRDMRQDFVVTTDLRNDLAVSSFNAESASYGTGQGRILDVVMTDENDRPLAWVVGGEMVKVHIRAEAGKEMFRPILGFAVKDRLGQNLFGDNTVIAYRDRPLLLRPGERIHGAFLFRMPVMPKGDYSIMVSIAEGTQEEHVQHHWVHDALLFRSEAPGAFTLMGIPMKQISMEKEA